MASDLYSRTHGCSDHGDVRFGHRTLDALGRQQGKPLWQVWGSREDPLPVYGSGCFELGHDGMIEKAERFVGEGFKAIKMQVAHLFTHDEDVINVRDA